MFQFLSRRMRETKNTVDIKWTGSISKEKENLQNYSQIQNRKYSTRSVLRYNQMIGSKVMAGSVRFGGISLDTSRIFKLDFFEN